MKPLIIVSPDLISDKDIEMLNANGICVITAKDPSKVKFVEPIPATSSRTEIEEAAIQLVRKIFAGEVFQHDGVKTCTDWFTKCLIKGSPLDSSKSKKELENEIYDSTRWDEIRKMAREDARAEKAAKQAKMAEEAAKQAKLAEELLKAQKAKSAKSTSKNDQPTAETSRTPVP